jgi:hypothetical protein
VKSVGKSVGKSVTVGESSPVSVSNGDSPSEWRGERSGSSAVLK